MSLLIHEKDAQEMYFLSMYVHLKKAVENHELEFSWQIKSDEYKRDLHVYLIN